MGSWEEPEVAFRNVTDEDASIRLEYRHSGIAIEHVGPLIGCMPVEFAVASSRQTHGDTSQVLRRGKLLSRDLTGPATVLDAAMRQVEGIPDRHHIPTIRTWGR